MRIEYKEYVDEPELRRRSMLKPTAEKVEARDKARIWLEGHLWVRPKEGGKLIPFVLNYAQELFLNTLYFRKDYSQPALICVLKARRTGISTIVEALGFMDTYTQANREFLVVAHYMQAAKYIHAMYKRFYDNYFPFADEDKLPLKADSRREVLYDPPHESSVSVMVCGEGNEIRAQNPHICHLSEVAFYDSGDPTELLTSIRGAMHDGSCAIVLESTANGVGGWFYKTWMDAVNGDNDYIPMFVPWFKDPCNVLPVDGNHPYPIPRKWLQLGGKKKDWLRMERDLHKRFNITREQINWRRAKVAFFDGDLQRFNQEFPATHIDAFIVSGNSVFDRNILQELALNIPPVTAYGNFIGTPQNFQFVENMEGQWRIWKHPQPGHQYIVAGDPGLGKERKTEGTSGDPSAAVVIDRQTWEYVAEFNEVIDPQMFAHELIKICRHYNDAIMAPELNAGGVAVIAEVKRTWYWNVIRKRDYLRAHTKESDMLGWETNCKTRRLMIEALKDTIRDGSFVPPSERLIEEMLAFTIPDSEMEKKNPSPVAEKGKHDDLVIATAIAIFLCKEMPYTQQDEEYASGDDKPRSWRCGR